MSATPATAPRTVIGPSTDYRKDFYEFGEAVYLNLAGQSPLPRVSVKALEAAVDQKKLPHLIDDRQFFDLPNRIRTLIADMVGGKSQEIAITTGATGGLAAVAQGIDWRPENEVLIAKGEFPAHFTTWMPLAAAGRLKVRIVEPTGAFISADDFVAQIGKNTKLVSVSLVRFDNGARLDAAKVAAACHSVGAFLLLDVSQCTGALPMNLRTLGADFAVCSGYKWLLSPYGTGFFWARQELIEQLRPQPFYWTAMQGAENFHALSFESGKVIPAKDEARRWDAPETSAFIHLSAMCASLEYINRIGIETVWKHCDALANQLADRLPLDRCVLASPRESAQRGPYACVKARTPEKTQELYAKLREKKIYVSLREGALRVAAYLYNTPRDVDRLLEALAI
ncbi:MAG: aminotransferase class V-fold PLP-dependent enzyme [Acidobacteria bacterium]|nr:aminotransferase class V-fold PLP-dependent enzyme [Acidobacteriota bacterium]